MRTQLLRACVLLLAAGAAVAADPPKGKTLPSTSTREMHKAEGRAEAVAEQNTRFTVTKPVGTWVREVPLGEAKCVCVLTVTDDRLTLTMEGKQGSEQGSVRLDADYAINKESCLFGVIDSCEVEHNPLGAFPAATKVPGQPFAVRFRVEGDVLTLKDLKGFGVGVSEPTDEKLCGMLAMACGRYTAQKYAADPLKRQEQLLNQSEGPAPAPLLIPVGGLKADPPTATHPSAFAGPVHVAMSELCPTQPPQAEFVLAKTEESVPLPLPPIPHVTLPPRCDPPTDAEVMAAFNARRVKAMGKGAPQVHDDITIVKNNLRDEIEPARAYPVVGLAQAHRCLWECSVYFNDTTAGGRKPRVEVVYIDTDCLHVCPTKGDVTVPTRMPER